VSSAGEFGAQLKAARERRGVALETIAAETKISASHFAAMERGDLTRWPSGIFARGFVRAYAEAVGLDPDATAAEFVRIAGEADRKGRAGAAVVPSASTIPTSIAPAVVSGPRSGVVLRLLLAEEPLPSGERAARPAGVRRIAPILVEAAALATAALAAWWWAAGGLPLLVTALATIAYYGAGMGVWGRSPLQRILDRRASQPANLDGRDSRGGDRRRIGSTRPANTRRRRRGSRARQSV
jgi:transcriptional regulator with XRE-family HTH domain